jgi:hypothetical protein
MKIHLRIDHSNPAHTTVSVFVNHGKAGELTLRTGDELPAFTRALGIGCLQAGYGFDLSGAIYDPDHDAQTEFRKP